MAPSVEVLGNSRRTSSADILSALLGGTIDASTMIGAGIIGASRTTPVFSRACAVARFGGALTLQAVRPLARGFATPIAYVTTRRRSMRGLQPVVAGRISVKLVCLFF